MAYDKFYIAILLLVLNSVHSGTVGKLLLAHLQTMTALDGVTGTVIVRDSDNALFSLELCT